MSTDNPSSPTNGWMYLLHFERPHEHAAHYLGSTVNLEQRMIDHANGDGARLTQVLAENGEHWVLAALWQPRTLMTCRQIEALAKRRQNGKRFCPLCNESPQSPAGCIEVPTPNYSSRSLRT